MHNIERFRGIRNSSVITRCALETRVMGKSERRNSLTLDEASRYWRKIRSGTTPDLNKVINSITTIDIAFGENLISLTKHLTTENWSQIRKDLFDTLLTSFDGQFLLYPLNYPYAIAPPGDWPEYGYIEFHPRQSNRKSDILRANLETIHPLVLLSLKWCFAEGRNAISPRDFQNYRESLFDIACDEEHLSSEFLDRLHDICIDEAHKSRKIAHRKWWHLSSEVSSCTDKKERNLLRKQIGQLETVWGIPLEA